MGYLAEMLADPNPNVPVHRTGIQTGYGIGFRPRSVWKRLSPLRSHNGTVLPVIELRYNSRKFALPIRSLCHIKKR